MGLVLLPKWGNDMQQQKKPAAAETQRHKRRGPQAILQSANGYIVRHYPFGCLGQNPQRLAGAIDFWIVPVFLTSPGYGAVGEVGMVAVNAATHEIVGATERRDVNRAIRLLKESKRDELEASFHRARTV
jgi:hypothetical protein